MQTSHIFNANTSLDKLNGMTKDNMLEHLAIEFIEIGEDHIKARMPVDHRTKQPHGLLHGGASVSLAETLGSVASNFCVDSTKYYCVGLEINANHVKSARDGYVFGITRPIHIGKSTHIWEIKITNEKEQLVCISRITMAVLEK